MSLESLFSFSIHLQLV